MTAENQFSRDGLECIICMWNAYNRIVRGGFGSVTWLYSFFLISNLPNNVPTLKGFSHASIAAASLTKCIYRVGCNRQICPIRRHSRRYLYMMTVFIFGVKSSPCRRWGSEVAALPTSSYTRSSRTSKQPPYTVKTISLPICQLRLIAMRWISILKMYNSCRILVLSKRPASCHNPENLLYEVGSMFEAAVTGNNTAVSF